MTISTTAAQIAAQSYVLSSGAPASAQRSQATPRRIETADLVDLTSRPEQSAKTSATKAPASTSESRAFSAPVGTADMGRVSPIARGDTRPARPGSQLDIKV
ncbi:MAG: hypothetical protein K8S25_17120 [Alphaproteobacteria bacterium]|nr:hypothetical protein [Alphaproteobacteria bacterium]